MTCTVRSWLALHPRLTPVMLAEHVQSPFASNLMRCAHELSKADPDDENGYCAAADMFERAESAFLVQHANTEVTLCP